MAENLGNSRTGKFSFHTVSEAEVSKALSELKPKKSTGIDEISSHTLKQVQEVVVTPLTFIINSAISAGVFPEAWKHSKIIPIHKRGDPTLDKKLSSGVVFAGRIKSSRKDRIETTSKIL